MPFHKQKCGAYVLLTAAYNEEAYIERTIQSVVSQTLPPQRWVIISDNSTDRTDEIVHSYAEKHDFIEPLRITRRAGHSFSAKVAALRMGEELLRSIEYDFIGNLDADLSLKQDYFEELVRHLLVHPELGLASGFVYEDNGKGFVSRWSNSVSNVPHAAQLVRRECYEAIGGYALLKYGGEDWYAQICAKMKGWQVESVPRLKIFHHRRTGASSTPIKDAFRLGRLDYSFGSDPMFEVVKCARKLSITRLLGFVWCYLSGEEKAVPTEVAAYLRREQRARMFSLSRQFL